MYWFDLKAIDTFTPSNYIIIEPFISSSLISLDSQGILGIKVILNNKVSFLPIEVLSDVGNGYWIKLKKPITDDILIITQGNEYVIDGDLISFKFEENVQ